MPQAVQAALYAPGATLDPACSPTDSNCGVITNVGTGTQGQVPYYAAAGNLLSATSTFQILTNGTASTTSLIVSNSFTLGSLSGFLKATAGAIATSLINLASDVTGILPVSNGGTGVSAIASGFIPFGNGTGAVATSSSLYWDNSNGRLGIGTTSPAYTLDVNGEIGINGTQIVYLPNQTNFLGSLVIGDGGTHLTHTTAEEGFYNTFMGISAGTSNTIGDRNTAVGQWALTANTTGHNNTALGQSALMQSIDGSYNTALGTDALNNNFHGHDNVAIGQGASFYSNTAHENVAVGGASLADNTTGAYNVAVGYKALQRVIGDTNTAVGYFAGVGVAGSSAVSNNTLVGYEAGATLLTGGNSNTLIGATAGYNLTTGSNNIVIGSGFSVPNFTGSNQINIGGVITGDISTKALTMPGTLLFNNNSNADGDNVKVNTTNKDKTYYAFVANRSGVNAGGIQIGGAYASTLGILTSDYPTFNNTVSWNNSGTTFRNIFSNVTDSASAAGSLLMDLQVGGTSKFNIRKDGQTIIQGNIGIGTTSPYALLSISNSRTTTANTPLFVVASTTGGTATTTVFSIASTGDVTVNGSSGSTCTIGNSTGATMCSSDERLKTNIALIVDPLKSIEQLRGVTFNWADTTKNQQQFIGVIAQDVQKVFPQAVATLSNGYLAVDYGALVAPLIEAVKELAGKVSALASTVAGFAQDFTSANGHFTNTLCVGSTCLTESQLQTLLQNSGQQSAPPPTSPEASQGTAQSGAGAGDTQAATTTDPVATSTPDVPPPPPDPAPADVASTTPVTE